MEPVDQSGQPDLAAALDKLWTRFLPEIRARVSILEAAAESAAANALTAEQQQAAASAAHKLAGVLGTFNLSRGTAIARELELLYSAEAPPGPGPASRLASASAELRSLVESRK